VADLERNLDLIAAGVTISGTVDGLEDNATSAASQVTILNDGDLSFGSPTVAIVGFATIFSNVWEVVAGQIVAVDFDSLGFELSNDRLTFLKTQDGSNGELFDGLVLISRSGPLVFSPIENGGQAPEPFAAGLLGLGLAALGLMRRRAA